jgi:hypothetical protein
MADVDLRKLLTQLQRLTPDQVSKLQSQVDVLGKRGSVSHHETTSHHHTSTAVGLPEIEGIEQQIR